MSVERRDTSRFEFALRSQHSRRLWVTSGAFPLCLRLALVAIQCQSCSLASRAGVVRTNRQTGGYSHDAVDLQEARDAITDPRIVRRPRDENVP
jgi:acetoacetate decarboxylase